MFCNLCLYLCIGPGAVFPCRGRGSGPEADSPVKPDGPLSQPDTLLFVFYVPLRSHSVCPLRLVKQFQNELFGLSPGKAKKATLNLAVSQTGGFFSFPGMFEM